MRNPILATAAAFLATLLAANPSGTAAARPPAPAATSQIAIRDGKLEVNGGRSRSTFSAWVRRAV
jgi:hypothetical protein